MGVQSEFDLAHALYPALATGDRDALDALLHPEFVGETTPGLPFGLGRTYRGSTEMRRDFWAVIGREFDLSARPTDFQELADGRLLVVGHYVGTARKTGSPLDAQFMHVLSFSDHQIIGLTQLTDSHCWVEALAAAAQPECSDTAPSGPDPTGIESGSLTTLTFSVASGVARIHLNRPEIANSLNVAAGRELRIVAQACAEDPEVRAVLITGEGRRFSGGGDISLFAATEHEELPGLLDAMISDYHTALGVLCRIEVPVVCAVQGAAAGGSLGLLYASDIVIAAAGTKFALGYVGIGLGSDGGNSWFLPRLVGPARAALMMLENQVLDAEEALRYGLISDVVEPEALIGRATELAERLAAGPTRSLGTIRSLLRNSWSAGLEDHLEAERRTMVQVAATHDAAEGISAFIQKRRPTFRGD